MTESVTTLAKWARCVKGLAGNRCVICGSGQRVEAHHVMPKAQYPEYALDVENGLCLCHNCHYMYHNGKYGYSGDDWQGMLPPDYDAYEKVKEYKEGLVFVVLPRGTADRIRATGSTLNGFTVEAVLDRLEVIEAQREGER